MSKKISVALALVLVVGLAFAVGVQAGGDRNSFNPNPRPEAKVGSSTKSGMPATAQSMYAVINPDGSKARAFNWDSSDRLAEGAYEVIFKQNISFCAFTASVGSSASFGEEDPGFITVVRRDGTTDGVFVATYDVNGDPADRGFHLVVSC